MTTSPDGELVPVERRLAEIQQRYGPGHLVSRTMQRATPMTQRAVEQVQDAVREPVSRRLVVELELDSHRAIQRNDQGRVTWRPSFGDKEHPVLADDKQPQLPVSVVECLTF
jgi:hypothetical protein